MKKFCLSEGSRSFQNGVDILQLGSIFKNVRRKCRLCEE